MSGYRVHVVRSGVVDEIPLGFLRPNLGPRIFSPGEVWNIATCEPCRCLGAQAHEGLMHPEAVRVSLWMHRSWSWTDGGYRDILVVHEADAWKLWRIEGDGFIAESAPPPRPEPAAEIKPALRPDRHRRKPWDQWLRDTAQVLEAHERAKQEREESSGDREILPGERGRQVEGPG